jgi:DNA-binding winged helix-turn-helix (wHTH) protein/tetratricopeptide (TPR) repeat protein
MNFLDRTFLPRIDLAREADFAVGSLRVRPSRREIEAGGIRLELQRRVMQVLVALAHPSAEVVSQDELISRCWGGLAVGEDAVGRCIGQLRRIAQQWPEPPFEISTIAGVGYRLDPAPETAAPDDDARRPRGLKTWAVVAASGAVVILAAAGLWLGQGVGPTAKAAGPRFAILPFEPLTASPAERAFATGLADQLQSVFSMGPIPVVSREDAQTLRGADEAKLRRLGVRLLFDGTVTTDHDMLRARVRLDDPGRHVTLWSAELSGPASNPEALEAQVGARAIDVINCAGQALRPDQGLADAEALALYLHACDIAAVSGWGDDAQAAYGIVDTFRQVTVRAPRFAQGHSKLAWQLAYYSDFLTADPRTEAEREARQALALDPKDSDAYVALALARPTSDYAGRERLMDKALALDPSSANANNFEAGLLVNVGRMREALAYLQRAAAANPVSQEANDDVAVLLVANGQTAAGNAQLERLSRLWPNSAALWYDRLNVYGLEGRTDDSLALLDDRQSWPKSFSDADVALIRTGILAGRSRTPAAIADARRQMLTAPARIPIALQGRIAVLAGLGLVDDAFQLADRWARWGMTEYSTPRFLFDPGMSAFRRDPRFMPFAARLGLVDYWRSSGKWPDFCAEPGLPYDCKKEAERLAARGGGR